MSAATRLVRHSLLASIAILATAGAAGAAPQPEAGDGAGVSSCTPVARTGTYRVLLRRDGAEPMPGLLVLERAAGCLSALLVTERNNVPLDSLKFEGGELRAVMRTERGPAALVLRFDEAGVTGTVTQGKRAWSVSGDRTS